MTNIDYNGDPKSFEHLYREGYDFDLSMYINEGWDIFKQYGWGFFGFAFLAQLISVFLNQIPFIGAIIGGILGAVLTAGFFIVADKIYNQQEFEFGTFFKGFDHIGQIILQVLVLWLFFIVLFAVIAGIGIWYAVASGLVDLSDFPGNFNYERINSTVDISVMVAMGLIIFGTAVYLSLAYSLSIPFILFGKLKFWDAMETSRKVVTKKFWSFFLMFFVFGLIMLAGFLVLIVGVWAAQGVVYCILYAAYINIAGNQSFDLESRIEEIGADADDETEW